MPYSRAFSLPIIIRFDIFKDTGLCPAPIHVTFSANKFDFQGVQEALRDDVIVAGGFAPHATTQTIAPDQTLISL